MMEFVFLIFSLLSSSSVTLIAHSDTTTTRDNDWNNVVLATVGEPVTLTCVDWSVRGTVKINWMVKSPGVDQWKLVLSANERKEFSGGSSKTSMRLADPNFADTGNFSLHFVPQMQDVGRYSCLIQGQKKTLKQRIILLAVLTVTATPSNPVPQHSILRLIMEAYPVFAVSTVTWQSPGGSPLRTETVAASRAVVAKLPQVNTVDNGVYVCVVRPRGNSSTPVFRFPVDVTMDASKVYSFTDIKHAEQISTACLSQSAFPLPCPPIQGDYVLVYWQPPDTRRAMDMKLLFLYDRWRGRTEQEKPQLQLAGPLEGGGFSFRLTPGGVKDGGLYCCEVFSNDNVFSQRTMLSVLKVTATNSSTSLVLRCQYSVLSQVKKAGWSHRDPNHRLLSSSSYPGSLSTTVPLPANENSSGDYTCTLQLKNGQTFRASYTVTLSPKDSNSVSRPSLLPSLSALLLLVPLVAAVAIVLLWRQGQITRRRGIEQSLSHYSGEVENIYENPEDIRQSSPQGSVYMDLKPIEEIEVYKELNRYDQCH